NTVVFLTLLAVANATPGCVPRDYPDGMVCVCNSTFCDEIEKLEDFIAPGTAAVYRTSLQGARMDKSIIKQTPNPSGSLTAELDTSTTYQEILGFGGAFTDSTGINLNSLRKETQNLLMRQYFGPTGSEYTFGRVPIASTDFSLREYSYDEIDGDFDLTHFALQNDDFQYKIPYIKQAIDLQKYNGGLRLFAAPWSAPSWMKINDDMKGGAKLRGEEGGQYYETWAKYIVKFFEAYLAEGISFWGVSPQNEPMTGASSDWKWQTMFFDAPMERNFVKNNLSPALKSSPATKELIIMGLDDQRWYLPGWADVLLEDKEASDLIAGIAVHWYEDPVFPVSALSHTHEKHPDKFILSTEACQGWAERQGRGPSLGNYTRGEDYAHSIIEDLNNWVGGWVDWNMALNTQGGYNWAMNFVDSPIIVETNKGEFLKQPMYYMLAHFSKFLKPGSHVVKLSIPNVPAHVEAVGVLMVDGRRYISVLNRNEEEDVTISFHEKGVDNVYTTVNVSSRSIATIIWSKY
ncbi:gba-4, partial [Pristionchus pacificus]